MANDITAGKAFVIFGAKFGPLDKALKKLNAKVRKTGDSLTAIGARMTAVGTAIVAPFAASTKAFSTFGDSIAKMSRRTGVSTEALSGLAHATELSGSTLAVLEKGLRGMARGLFDAKRGTGEMKDAMTELNLKYTDLEGLSPEEQFFKISDAIKGVQDPTIKAALAMKIFGRAGSELVPLMDEGSDGMRKMMKDAADLGLVLDSKTAKQAEILTDQMLRAGRSIRALSIVIGATLAPTVSFLSDKLIAVSKTFIGFIKENKGLVISIAATGAAIIAVGGTILSLGVAITGLSIIMPGVISLFSGLFAIFSPMGLLIGALITTLLLLGDTLLGVFDVKKLGIAEFIGSFKIAGLSIGAWIEIGVLTAQLSLLKLKNSFFDVTGFIGATLQEIPTVAEVAFKQMLAALVRVGVSINKFFIDMINGLAENVLGLLSKLPLIGDQLKELSESIKGGLIPKTVKLEMDANVRGFETDADNALKKLKNTEAFTILGKQIEQRQVQEKAVEIKLNPDVASFISKDLPKKSGQDVVSDKFASVSDKMKSIFDKIKSISIPDTLPTDKKLEGFMPADGGGVELQELQKGPSGKEITGSFSGLAAFGGAGKLEQEQKKTNVILKEIGHTLKRPTVALAG